MSQSPKFSSSNEYSISLSSSDAGFELFSFGALSLLFDSRSFESLEFVILAGRDESGSGERFRCAHWVTGFLWMTLELANSLWIEVILSLRPLLADRQSDFEFRKRTAITFSETAAVEQAAIGNNPEQFKPIWNN